MPKMTSMQREREREIPSLGDGERRFLTDQLPPGHPWQSMLAVASRPHSWFRSEYSPCGSCEAQIQPEMTLQVCVSGGGRAIEGSRATSGSRSNKRKTQALPGFFGGSGGGI